MSHDKHPAVRLGELAAEAMASGDDGAVAAAVIELEFYAMQAGDRIAAAVDAAIADELEPVGAALNAAGASALPLIRSTIDGLRMAVASLEQLEAKLR